MAQSTNTKRFVLKLKALRAMGLELLGVVIFGLIVGSFRGRANAREDDDLEARKQVIALRKASLLLRQHKPE